MFTVHICTIQSLRTEQAIIWMERWFNDFGDNMPDTRMIHLPQFLTREAVYKEMAHDMHREGINTSNIISLAHFYATWSDIFPHVSIPKVRNQIEHLEAYIHIK